MRETNQAAEKADGSCVHFVRTQISDMKETVDLSQDALSVLVGN